MNKNTIKALVGIAVMLSACDYNEEHFDGLDEMIRNAQKNIVTENYTLTADDYAAISKYNADELSALASSQTFASSEIAHSYIIKFLGTKFPTADATSVVNVTYNVIAGGSEKMVALNTAKNYSLNSNDYSAIWDNEKVKYLTPSTTNSITAILAKNYADAKEGDYAAVTYKFDNNEPVISGEAAPATYNSTSKFEGEGLYVIATKSGDDYVPFGVLTDESKAYGYFAADPIAVKDGKVSLSDAENYVITIAKTTNGYSLKRPDGKFIYQAGKYDSFNIGEYPEEGGDWNITATEGGKFNIVNAANSKCIKYETGYSSFGSYASEKYEGQSNYQDVVLFELVEPDVKGNEDIIASAPETIYAIFKFDGTKWSTDNDIVMLTAADYKAMGQRYGNLSSSALPNNYLPGFLASTYPYAQQDEVKTIAYFYYDSASKETSVRADSYKYVNGTWIKEAETSQFVKKGNEWIYDPSVIINLPYVKNDPVSTPFYQAVTDWVWANIDQADGCTDKGQGYVTSYGNNEYFTGSSAYQNDVDWRASAAKAQNETAYDGMDDKAIVEKMQENLITTYAATLGVLYPNATTIEGLDVTYTINFSAYMTEGTFLYQVIYRVIGNGQFEYVEDSLKKLE